MEILSPSTAERDRGYKLTMYARYGILGYWIVDPNAQTIDVYCAGATEYGASIRDVESDVVICALLRDFKDHAA